MEEIKLIKPHNEGDSDLEVAVNGKKWKINIGETENVPDFIATEVRRSIAQSDGLGLTDHREAEPEESSGGSGGGESGGGNVETATIEITVTDGTPEITSGAFPDWCTEANNDYIYGRAYLNDINTSFYGVFESGYETALICFNEVGATYGIAKDLSLIINGEDGTPLTGDWIINITLIYMPNEN